MTIDEQLISSNGMSKHTLYHGEGSWQRLQDLCPQCIYAALSFPPAPRAPIEARDAR